MTTPYRVAQFWSTSTPGTKVLMIAEGADIDAWPHRDDFITWADTEQLADAARLEKLLSMVTDCKIKFDTVSNPKQLTIIAKNSVQTSAGFRAELRKVIDDINPTWES